MAETVFITGITGFVGYHLAEDLRDRGYDVAGLARYVSDRDLDTYEGIDVHLGDITDSYTVREIYDEVQPDHIVHLAMQSSVEYSFNHPVEAYEVGFNGTVHLAECAMEVLPDLESFVLASSVEVYGNQETSPLHEELSPNPASPYGVAKVAKEQYVDYLERAHGFPAITFRSTNTYGRRYNHRFVIEHIIHDMLTGVDTLEMGNPYPVRDFLYIEDEVDAYVEAIERDSAALQGEIINTGTTRGVTIRELVDLIADATGWNGEVEWEEISDRPLEIDSLVIDNEKIGDVLDWEPTHTLEEGLEETVAWWADYLDEVDGEVPTGLKQS